MTAEYILASKVSESTNRKPVKPKHKAQNTNKTPASEQQEKAAAADMYVEHSHKFQPVMNSPCFFFNIPL